MIAPDDHGRQRIGAEGIGLVVKVRLEKWVVFKGELFHYDSLTIPSTFNIMSMALAAGISSNPIFL
jgi:hypothetical protein